MDHEQVQMFVSITGASEDVARDKIQAHGGNLNAAINSFYNEGEPAYRPLQISEVDMPQAMEEDEPLQRQPIGPLPSYPAPSAPPRTGVLPGAGGLVDRASQWMEGDESSRRQPTPPFPAQSTPARTWGLPGAGGFEYAGNRAPFRDNYPIFSQTRDSRQAAIDEEPRVRSRAAIVGSENAHIQSQAPTDFVSDEDEVSGPTSEAFRAGGDRSQFDRLRSDHDYHNANLNAPLVDDVPAISHNEGSDIEEEMIRAAIEASRKETTGLMGLPFKEGQAGGSVERGEMLSEEDHMAWALSQSLKTAEEEKAMRESLVNPGSSEEGFLQDNTDNLVNPSSGPNYDFLNRRDLASIRENNVLPDSGKMTNSSVPPSRDVPVVEVDSREPLQDSDEMEGEPLLRRRPGRRLNAPFTPPMTEEEAPALIGAHQVPSHSPSAVAYPSSPPERNGHARQTDEWAGLSSEEQDEAVMLEAAMFGSLPDGVAARFRYPSVAGGLVQEADILENGLRNYPRLAPLPPSPTVIAQRLLREQQDDEYLASLEADREKAVRAQLEEEEAKAAARAENKLRQEEELRKSRQAEELERELAAKRAALPEEPSVDDEKAVTLMVRMPDGSRQGRRFRKSEHLQCLFDFIDVSGGVVPGSYRLVRQYPRKAFTDGEHDSSFLDLGLSSKHEVLMLELI